MFSIIPTNITVMYSFILKFYKEQFICDIIMYCVFLFIFSYVVPESGLYLVSASLKLQDASSKLSSFTLNIAANGDPSTFTNQNGIQDFIENNFDPPLAK